MTEYIIGSVNIDIFNKPIIDAKKYCNFTNNKNIPSFEIMCIVYDIDHCNKLFKLYNLQVQFEEQDYENDNLIIINFDRINVAFVYVFNKQKQCTGNDGSIVFWLKHNNFIGLKHVILFKPKYEKQNSLIKPRFSFFPYFFGERDKQIIYFNNIYYSYFCQIVDFTQGFLSNPVYILGFNDIENTVSFLSHYK